MKKPFDIKYRPQIESGEYKVVTRDGRPVRIVCWDRVDNKDAILLGLAYNKEYEVEEVICNKPNGVAFNLSENDIFIIDEPEVTEFERALSIEIYGQNAEDLADIELEQLKLKAEKLLDIARKQLKSDDDLAARMHLTSKAYSNGFETGNAEALKDIPKWRKSKTEWDSNKEHYYKGYYIDLEELFDKLPKEE